MSSPMPLEPAFVADCPYGPGGLLIDDIVEVDRDAGRVRCRLPTPASLPITESQRTHPVRHPAHVSGGLMVHVSGIVGFVHAYYVLDLRHADGWVGYGVRIHDARFSKLAALGPPMLLDGVGVRVRRVRDQIFVRYQFSFTQEGETVYVGDQSAVWTRTA